jgi:hypothetical protein
VAREDAGQGLVTEVAVATTPGRIAVAWIVDLDTEARAQARIIDQQTLSMGPLLDLGQSAQRGFAARNRLALATGDSKIFSLARAPQERCDETPDERCAVFRFHRLTTTEARQRGMPLIVPAPCEWTPLLFQVADGRFHYGLCHVENQRPVTTMFTIQYEPEYARADPLLTNCDPLGTQTLGQRVAAVGACATGKRLVFVGGGGTKPEPLSLSGETLACENRELVMTTSSDAPLKLTEPAQIHALLSADAITRGVRAVWTGQSVLAVTPLEAAREQASRELHLTATGCTDGRLSL